MNIFYLDDNIDKNAEYHVDSHVSKMPTEAAQMLTTTVWVDKLIGFAPRKLTSDELNIIKEFKATQGPIGERDFTHFLPSHLNHPCTIWARSSAGNYEWLFLYVSSLNSEWQFRFRHDHNHKSYEAALALPDPKHLINNEITIRPQCMPDEYKDENTILAYRMFYMGEKAPFAVWKRRSKPEWWDENLAEYGGRDPHECYLNTIKAPTNKGRLYARDYDR
jgi:hypothetical protein